MALNELESVSEGLLEQGLDPATPAAVISRGTFPDQEVAVADLAGIAEAAAGLPGPALVVVGEVVSLRKRLQTPKLSFSQRFG
jgi:siroheme synthase